jgi:diguanylate cyclase (GGDEF)-like protein/PAS domain S-box-containing protein
VTATQPFCIKKTPTIFVPGATDMSFDTQLETGTRWPRALAQGSTLLGVLMIGLVWISLSFHLEAERSHAERAAVQNADNLARAFEEHLSRSIKDIDRSLKILRANYMLNPEGFSLTDIVKSSQLFDDQTLQVTIIGPDGFVKASSIESSSPPGTIDLRDREHFRFHVDSRSDDLFISKPVIGRITGKMSIQLTRRIENRDGSFGGVIVVSLDPNYLARFYSSVDVGIDGYVRVVGTDRIIRAAGGRTPGPLGRDISGANLFKYYPAAATGWFYTESSFSDHIARIITFRAVKDFPLIVTIGLSTAEIFAGVNAKRGAYRLVAAAITALILVGIVFSVRRRLALDSASERLRTQNLRFNAVLTNMPLGVCMFDGKDRLAIANEQYARMYGLPPEAVRPGAPLREIVEHLKANGVVPEEAEASGGGLIEQPARGALIKRSVHLDDGRVISALNQPMDGGGWVSIHEDTTEQQRARTRLEQTRKFLDTIIENVPAPIVVKDAQTQIFVLVNQAYEEFVGLPRERLIGRTVFELFPKDAELISRYDDEAVQFNSQSVSAEFAVETPVNGMRMVTTARLVVRDEEEQPLYVIVVIEDVTEKRKAEERVAFMAHHDALTGLLNRARLTERLDHGLARVRRGEQLAVMFLDLDQFKHVNDTLGHLAGDELLKNVARRLLGCVKQGDCVARLGGDEFAVIATEIKHPGDISFLADRIRSAIKAPYDLGGHQAYVGVSIGISCAPDHGTASAELMKRADMALYTAKVDGRDMYRFFEPEMDARVEARRKMVADLRDALVNGEFEMFYQPVVDIKSNEIVGVEGLLRWHHPERGIVLPAEFIRIAEETGLIIPLGEWVIRQACADAAHWPAGIKIAANLSPAQFRSQNLAQVVIGALTASGVPPCRLELEITEEMFFESNRDNLAVLEQLRKIGVQIVMDDFGIGYSSLNYLRSFQFDKIKIDRSFVNDLSDGNELSLAIVQAVASLARVLDVPATAEGIETKEQLALVRAAGCTEFQGYLFSAPKTAKEIARLFQRNVQAISAA